MKKHILIAGSILVGVGIMNVIPVKNSKGNALKDDVIVSDVIENKSHTSYYANAISKVDQDYTIEKENYEPNNEDTINDDIKIVYDESSNENNNVVNNNNIDNLESINDEEVSKTKDEEEKTEEIKSDVSVMDAENASIKPVNIETKDTISDEKSNLKNGFIEEDGSTYYYENDNKVTGIKNIDGIDNYFSPSGKHLGTSKIKVVDVSYYQKDIDWEKFKNESDCYGVILRLGYYETLDKKFISNLNELKRLNIPYGIYLFSYSTTLSGAKKEANFTNNMISTYDITPTLGIYYDIESWNTKNSSSNEISKDMYNKIVEEYINTVNNYNEGKYKVKVYSGRWYAMNRLGEAAKNHVDWVAEYNSTCKYDGAYSMWQYTSKGSVPGIEGNVDISYIAL